MKTRKAVIGGLIAALVVTTVMAVARLFTSMTANLEMMYGTLFGSVPSLGAWIVGLFIHLAAGIAVALLYAVIFENVVRRGGWQGGAVIGILLGLVTGLMLVALPAVHPLIPDALPAPGVYMVNLPAGVGAFFVLHLLYGIIVGTVYGAPLRKGGSR